MGAAIVGSRLGLIRRLLPLPGSLLEEPGLAGLNSTRTRLAYRNLKASGARGLVSVLAIAFATFLMSVQGSLIASFTRAASRIIDTVDADVWIVGKGSPTLEFLPPIPERYADLALGVKGVRSAGRGVSGMIPFRRSNGNHTFINLVGIEDAFRGRIPDISAIAAREGVSDSALILDATDHANLLGLGFSGETLDVEVAGRRARIVSTTSGFSSFLGTAIVLANYVDVRRYVQYDKSSAGMILVRIADDIDPETVRDRMRARFPDMDIWTSQEFSWRSRVFWLAQTGAGAALALAGILGFAIGLAVVAQTVYALTAENIEEFATLKAIGASDGDVQFIVLTQSLICGAIGGLIGLAVVEPFAMTARTMVTWLIVPPWMYVLVITFLIVLCVCAARIAVRPALAVDPGRVFRV